MSTNATDGPGGRLRASDAERERIAEIVREAVGEGRLTLDEGDERLAAVYATKYRDELPPLLTDLPGAEPDPAPAGAGRDHRAGEGRRGQGHRGEGRRGAGHRGEGHRWADSAWADATRAAGPGHPPWGGRRPRFGFGFVLLAVAVLAVVSAVTGAHFFWPVVPLIFVGLFLVRGACLFRYGYGPRRRW